MSELEKWLERGVEHAEYSDSVQRKLAEIAKTKEIISQMQSQATSREADVKEISYAVQNGTIELASIVIAKLKPHTLPVNMNLMSAEAGKPGIELTRDGRIFIIFINGSRLLTTDSIQNDPAVLHQFRERLPAFLESYGRKHDSRLLELVKEMSCLKALGAAIGRLDKSA